MIQSWLFWVVLAAAVPAHWALPSRYRPWFLFVVSLGYLASLDLLSVGLLLLWSAAFYWLAPLTVGATRSARAMFALLVLGILGYLAAFKYVPVILRAITVRDDSSELIIPLGISYFTFKLIHYAIETSRGRLPQRSLGAFLSYMYVFTAFTAGPIERYEHFIENREERWSLDSISTGATRIIHGLVKRFVLVQIVILPLMDGLDAERVVRTLPRLGSGQAWLYCIGTLLIVYLDFSAYSDIAIGASRLFGVRLMENFNWPMLAVNISDFWRRWHMTLSGWCRTYIYMPLIGATRNPYVAIGATFLAIGVWHAASPNLVAWGLFHAVGVSAYATWDRFRRRRGRRASGGVAGRVLGVLLTFAFVSSSMAFSSLDGVGGLSDSVRLLALLVGLELPG